MEPKGSLYCLQQPVTGPCSEMEPCALKMEIACFSKMLASSDQPTQNQNPEEQHHHGLIRFTPSHSIPFKNHYYIHCKYLI